MTQWQEQWENGYRRQRWIERDGLFYPRGTPLTVIELDVAARRAKRLGNARRCQLANAARKLLASSTPAALPALPGAA